MTRPQRKKARGSSPGPRPAKSISLGRAMAIPGAACALLTLPLLGLGYFWDDFLFLTGGRAGGGPLRFLWPQAGEAFYRPVGQSLYFIFLRAVDPESGFVGHLTNLLVLVACTVLVVRLVSALTDRRAGMLAGLLFACSGHVASLVAWITCNHDLFAIFFTLAALWFRHREKNAPAVGCFALALLSKEVAAGALPVLVAWDWIVGRSRTLWGRRAIPFVVLILAWAAIHPGVRALAGHGFASGATGYVGIEHPERWGAYFLRYLMTLVNLPAVGFTPHWPDGLTIAGLAAIALVVVSLIAFDRGPLPRRPDGDPKARPAARAAAVAGLLLAVPTLLMPALLVRHWAPYFAAFPTVGLAIAAGPALARAPKGIAVVFVAVFALFGVWVRGTVPPTASLWSEAVWSETVFQESAQAAATVRDHFRTALPRIPPRSEVVLSIGATGVLGIRGTLVDYQALRVWYRDPSIVTVPTLQRDPGAPTEILARVTSTLEVVVIDPKSGAIRTATGAAPDWFLVGRTLRNYAREIVADGDLEGGVHAMDILQGIEPTEIRPYNRGLVAMMLIASGRRDEARRILAPFPPFERIEALRYVHRLLAEASSSETLDLASFEAFGVSANDPEAIRWIVREFLKEKSLGQAAYWARRLARLVPGDPEAAQIEEEARRAGATPERVADVAPVPGSR